MNHNDSFSLTTKRLVIGHVTVCQGCCCGNTANGRPPVPVDWLKNEWRARGLLKRVQLTVSDCLGPCDIEREWNRLARGHHGVQPIPIPD